MISEDGSYCTLTVVQYVHVYMYLYLRAHKLACMSYMYAWYWHFNTCMFLSLALVALNVHYVRFSLCDERMCGQQHVHECLCGLHMYVLSTYVECCNDSCTNISFYYINQQTDSCREFFLA